MARSQKSKRVSWPSDVNLCQIRLFLSEDSPSQVGVGAQDNLQVKASWLLHSAGVGVDDQLPPGFEGAHSIDQLEKEVPQIALVKWQCPPRFVPNPHWRVVAGDESNEAEVQKQREMRVLEAIYPRPSAIPPSPSVSSELENSHFEDHKIPLIPVTPIEDEDVTASSDSTVPTNNPVSAEPQALPQSLGQGIPRTPQSNGLTAPKPVGSNDKSSAGTVPGVEPDVVAAASAAFTAIMKSSEQGSLIDHELLINILNNPKLIEKLVTDYGATTNSQTVPIPSSLFMDLSVTQSGPPPLGYTDRVELNTPMSVAPTCGVSHSLTNVVTAAQHPAPVMMHNIVKPPPVKDIYYYKSLIQQHGGEKAEVQQEHGLAQFGTHHQNIGSKTELLLKQRESSTKTKNKRPCIYFNSSRGCKHGANCAFPHDISVQQQRNVVVSSVQEAQGASKRMKLDTRELTGRL